MLAKRVVKYHWIMPICDPEPVKEAFVCGDCGRATKNATHICKPQLKKLNYTCSSCGRVTTLAEKLCKPEEIV